MILGNYNILNSNPGKAIGGVTDPTIWLKGGTLSNYIVSDYENSLLKYNSYYYGFNNQTGFGQPFSSGALS